LELGIQEASRNSHDLNKKSNRLSKLETKTLLEIFRKTLNKGKGDLFQTILNQVDQAAELHDI
jgi:hypothetical protein